MTTTTTPAPVETGLPMPPTAAGPALPGTRPTPPAVGPTLAERFNPRPADDARYETAIARRNTAWARWREAAALLEVARSRPLWDTQPYVQNQNDALRDYEHAATDLIRERVRWASDGVPW